MMGGKPLTWGSLEEQLAATESSQSPLSPRAEAARGSAADSAGRAGTAWVPAPCRTSPGGLLYISKADAPAAGTGASGDGFSPPLRCSPLHLCLPAEMELGGNRLYWSPQHQLLLSPPLPLSDKGSKGGKRLAGRLADKHLLVGQSTSRLHRAESWILGWKLAAWAAETSQVTRKQHFLFLQVTGQGALALAGMKSHSGSQAVPEGERLLS